METLKVYQKWEDMLIYLYIALKNYPRSERYTLAARTTECATTARSILARIGFKGGLR